MVKFLKTIILSVGKGAEKSAHILVVDMQIKPTFLKCNLAIKYRSKAL